MKIFFLLYYVRSYYKLKDIHLYVFLLLTDFIELKNSKYYIFDFYLFLLFNYYIIFYYFN
jgi:hypothetical protein